LEAKKKMKEAEEQLCEAARKGDVEKVKTLIDSGADVTYFDGEGLNPLMYAAKHGHAPVLTLLLSAGAPWNALSPSSLSAGDYAMQEGHSEAYDLLLNAGKDSSFPFRLLLFAYWDLIWFQFARDSGRTDPGNDCEEGKQERRFRCQLFGR